MENKLAYFRHREALTQKALAEAVEVSRQTIIALEQGRYNPSLILAFKLAHYFNVQIEDLFLYEEDIDG